MTITRASTFESLGLRLRRVDGATELAMAEAMASGTSRPEIVTAILAIMLAKDDGTVLLPEDARRLPSALREWLLQCIGQSLRPGLRWFEASCGGCGAVYDLEVDLEASTYQQTETPLNGVTVCTSLGMRQFAVPTGLHEERAAKDGAWPDGRRQLSAICGVSDTRVDDAACFNEHDLCLIDEALEAASPDVADGVEAICPDCGRSTFARIDPLRFAFPAETQLLSDIHLIASAYGWPLDSVLKISARHRASFASAIARDRRAGIARMR